jgi:hypothetical protein
VRRYLDARQLLLLGLEQLGDLLLVAIALLELLRAVQPKPVDGQLQLNRTIFKLI